MRKLDSSKDSTPQTTPPCQGEVNSVTPVTGTPVPVSPDSDSPISAPQKPYTPAREAFIPFDLEAYLLKHRVCPEAEDYIRRAQARPSLGANGYFSNTIRHADQKQGTTAELQSLNYEYPAYLTARARPDVLRIFEQPPKLNEYWVRTSGKKCPFGYTPDFLVLTDAGVEVWEVKPASKLREFHKNDPERYPRLDDGSIGHKPAADYFSVWNFHFKTVNEHNLCGKFVQAVLWLRKYVTSKSIVEISEDEHRVFLYAVARFPGLELRDIAGIEPARRAELAYHFLAKAEIFTHLSETNLREPESLRLYPTACEERAFTILREGSRRLPKSAEELASFLRPGVLVEFDGNEYEVVYANAAKVLLRIGDEPHLPMFISDLFSKKPLVGKIFHAERELDELFRGVTIEDRLTAARRKKIIAPYLPSGDMKYSYPRSRTHREWLKNYRQQERDGLPGELALIPKYWNGGKKESRLPQATAEMLNSLIKEYYMVPNPKSAQWLWETMVIARKEMRLLSRVPSKRTVFRFLERLDPHKVALRQRGKKYAVRFKPMLPDNDVMGSPHGKRSWDKAHMDSTLMDVAKVDTDKTGGLCRDRIAKMVDPYDGRILAYVFFDGAPSALTTRSLILECLARHGRLPGTIVCDWGSEFKNAWLETAMASLGVDVNFRPKGSGPSGGHVEEKFSKLGAELLKNVQGATHLTKTPRLLTEAVHPKNMVLWPEEQLRALVAEYIELSNDLPQKNGWPSPNALAKACDMKYGSYPAFGLDAEDVRRTLLPFVNNTTRTVSDRGTIRCMGGIFYSDALRIYHGKDVKVRYDPDEPDIVYAFPPDRNQIVPCKLIKRGRPDADIIAAAVKIDEMTLGPSTVDDVKPADEKRAEFTVATIRAEADLRKGKKRQPKKTALAPTSSADDDAELPQYSFVPLRK